MKIRYLTLALTLLSVAPIVHAQGTPAAEAAAAVPADVLQAAQAALAAGDLKGLRAVFEANPKIALELASALTSANKSAAPTIAAVAAEAYPAKAAQIASTVAGLAPEQRDAIYAAVTAVANINGSGLVGSNGQFNEVFPTTSVDPSIVSPSS